MCMCVFLNILQIHITANFPAVAFSEYVGFNSVNNGGILLSGSMSSAGKQIHIVHINFVDRRSEVGNF